MVISSTKTKLDRLLKQGKKALQPQLLPHLIKSRLATYAPFLGAGIQVVTVDFDQGLCVTKLGLTRLNKSPLGGHFRGSLFGMTEPFLMILLTHKLGKHYQVVDQSAHIDFIKDSHDELTARIKVDTQRILAIMEATKDGAVHQAVFEVDVCDESQKVVAKIQRHFEICLKDQAS